MAHIHGSGTAALDSELSLSSSQVTGRDTKAQLPLQTVLYPRGKYNQSRMNLIGASRGIHKHPDIVSFDPDPLGYAFEPNFRARLVCPLADLVVESVPVNDIGQHFRMAVVETGSLRRDQTQLLNLA